MALDDNTTQLILSACSIAILLLLSLFKVAKRVKVIVCCGKRLRIESTSDSSSSNVSLPEHVVQVPNQVEEAVMAVTNGALNVITNLEEKNSPLTLSTIVNEAAKELKNENNLPQ